MRRILLVLALLLIRFVTIAQKDCRYTEYIRESISKDPSIAAVMQQVQNFTLQQLKPRTVVSASVQTTANGLPVITIPVVVHIIYNSSEQNISDDQVLSQIAVLNTDYRKLNADTARIPSYYLPYSADCGFQFALAKVDTNGYATSGIVRRHTNIQSFSLSDNMKITANGGDNAWDRDHYLNIWVCNLSGGIAGYSSVPGGPKATDGVVIQYTAFGTTGMAKAPFNLGRTATHEIGHWLNMIHLWGDTYCGNDYVDDTPQQQQANRGNPDGILITCGNDPYGDMYMDFMDLTDDCRMNMFTCGQRDRMRTLFAPGGCRASILNSVALTATPIPDTSVPTNPAHQPTPETAAPALSIYPNPASGNITIKMTDETRLGSMLDVYNSVGQKVLSTRLDQLQVQLNVSSLQQGVYFIRIRDNGQQSLTKLIKI